MITVLILASLVRQGAFSGSRPQVATATPPVSPAHDFFAPTADPDEIRLGAIADCLVPSVSKKAVQQIQPSRQARVALQTQGAPRSVVEPVLRSIDESPIILRAKIMAGLRLNESQRRDSSQNLAGIPARAAARMGAQSIPISATQALALPNAQRQQLAQRLIALGTQTPSQSPRGLRPFAAGNADVTSTIEGTGGRVYSANYSWDKDINWSSAGADSKFTFTSTLTSTDPDPVFTRLVYQWTMAGGAPVWSEILSANGTWYNAGAPAPFPIGNGFSGYYVNADGNTYATFDRFVEQHEAQNRIHWQADGAGTIQHWHMDGDAISFTPPSPLPSGDRLPRRPEDSWQYVEVGLPGWQHTSASNAQSSGFIIDPGVKGGRVKATDNTGLNRGDKVYLSVDGAIMYRTSDGFYLRITHGDGFRAVFTPADGTAPVTLNTWNFPWMAPRRGSLGFFVDTNWIPNFTASFGRGGYLVSVQVARSPDTDGDGLNDYEEVNGMPSGDDPTIGYRSDATRVDGDGDTVSDFDEIFGWQYVDRRKGTQTIQAKSSDPWRPDALYAKIHLRNATMYKTRFRTGDVSYADAIATIDRDRQAELEIGLAATAASSLGDGPGNQIALDIAYEQAAQGLLRAQDKYQQAFDTKFTTRGSGALQTELGLFGASESEYSKALEIYLSSSTDPTKGLLTKRPVLFESAGPTRTPWDEDTENVQQVQPYRDMVQLAKLFSGRASTQLKQAKLLILLAESNSATGDSQKDQAREILGRAEAQSFVASTLLESQLPNEAFTAEPGRTAIPVVATQVSVLRSGQSSIENYIAQVNSESVNSLGADPGLVKFMLVPSDTRPIGPNGQVWNNFLEHDLKYLETNGPYARAQLSEQTALTAKRTFETDQTQFQSTLFQTQETYRNELTSLDLQFQAANAAYNTACLEEEKARNQLGDIYKRIVVEQQRVAAIQGIRTGLGEQIAQVYLDTGEAFAANEIALGEINATDAMIHGFEEAASAGSIGFPSLFTFNPGQFASGIVNAFWGPYAARERGEIAASNARLQALEKARVSYLNIRMENALDQAESEARIKTMLLEISNAALDVRIRLVEVCEALSRLHKLSQLMDEARGRRDEASGLATALYNDPSFRLIRDYTREVAERDFEEAQYELYVLGRSLEYQTSATSKALPYVFTAANVKDLSDTEAKLKDEWQRFNSGVGAPERATPKISLRRDVLGFRESEVDPQTGVQISAIDRFRRYLKDLAANNGNVIVIDFYAPMNEPPQPNSTLNTKLVLGISRNYFNTKMESLRVFLEGERGDGKLGDSTAVVTVVLDGAGWIRMLDGTVRPPATAVNLWAYPENVQAVSVRAFRFINGQFVPGSPGVERTIGVNVGDVSAAETRSSWGLYDQSPVRRWRIVLNLNDSPNRDIRLESLDDIRLELDTISYNLPGG